MGSLVGNVANTTLTQIVSDEPVQPLAGLGAKSVTTSVVAGLLGGSSVKVGGAFVSASVNGIRSVLQRRTATYPAALPERWNAAAIGVATGFSEAILK